MPPYDDRLFVPPAPLARVVVRHPEREPGFRGQALFSVFEVSRIRLIISMS